MTDAPAPPAHITWPPERFYWAGLDGSVVAGALNGFGPRKRRERLGYLFEAVLPGVPIEDVHAVYARLPGSGHRYVACGVPRATLERDVDDGAMTLTPAALPPFLRDEIDPARLNLLTGPFTPRHVRRLGRSAIILAAAAVVACAVLLTLGVERRVTALDADARRFGEAEMQVYEAVLGPGVRGAVGTSFPPARRLLVELRRLEATRSERAPVPEEANCALILASVLASWPPDIHVLTETLTVTSSSVVIRGTVPAMGDAQDLADALQEVPGWTVARSQTQAKRDGVEVTLRLAPRADAGGGAGVGAGGGAEDRP